jgi:hypothetical protein
MKHDKLAGQGVQPPSALLDALVRTHDLYVSRMDGGGAAKPA